MSRTQWVLGKNNSLQLMIVVVNINSTSSTTQFKIYATTYKKKREKKKKKITALYTSHSNETSGKLIKQNTPMI